jgi:hypothetical protein
METTISFIAIAFVLGSFLATKMATLRLLNLVGAALWFAYGLLIDDGAIMFLNAVITLIHTIYFIRLYHGKIQ